MKMRTSIIGGVTGLVVMAGAAALAVASPDSSPNSGDARPHRGQLFEATDTNKDGVLSKDEFEARGGEMFSKMDTNKDGIVTKLEMSQAAQKKAAEHAEKRFTRMDSNNDGKITQAEFAALSDQRFAKMDKNSDGKLEKGEGRHGMRHGGHGPDDDMPPPEDGALPN